MGMGYALDGSDPTLFSLLDLKRASPSALVLEPLDARVEYTNVIGHVRVVECCSQEMLQLDAHADWTGWIGC